MATSLKTRLARLEQTMRPALDIAKAILEGRARSASMTAEERAAETRDKAEAARAELQKHEQRGPDSALRRAVLRARMRVAPK